MENVEKEILQYPLRILKWSGQNPEQSKTKIFIIAALNAFLGIILLILYCVQLFHADGSIVTIVQNCEGLGAVAQIVAKLLITAIKLKDFRKMIKSTTQFWSIKKSVGNGQIILNTFVQILKLVRLFVHLMISGAISFVVMAFFTKQLPVGAWTWKNHQTLYTYTRILQSYFFSWCAIFTVGYETLFLIFCILLRTQFKMLHDAFEDLKVSTLLSKSAESIYFSKLTSYVQHHDFLLRFSKDLRDAYSPILLVMHSSLLMIHFAEMSVILESKSILLLARHSFAMVVVLLQLAVYCIPLNYITDEAISVSQGIYNSDWHSKHYPGLKSVVPLIIQRSQREIIFRAGGLVEMNCATLISVIRVSYSVSTIFRGLNLHTS